MEAERDLAGIALPFAAGVAAVAFYGGLFHTVQQLCLGVAYSCIIMTSALLLHPTHNALAPNKIRLAICLCLACCGLLCGLTSEILKVCIPSGRGILEYIGSSGHAMGKAIDSISFHSRDTNAIIKALLIGDRSDIPVHITEAFRESGASHILALSGLHLGIIYAISTKLLSFIGNSPWARVIRSVATVLICGFYTLATGAGASITRAFLFILIGETARLTGRFRSTGTVLMTSLLIHLAIIPQDLREAGFQLSYAAMAGIAFILPWLSRFWPETAERKSHLLKWMWNTAAMSISCQITTGPIAYMYFGTFPVHFLLTNMIALPLTGIIIPASLLTLLLDILGICPPILSRASEMLIATLSKALEIISSM